MEIPLINCMIVDDEDHAITSLTRLVKKTPSLNLIFATTNPIEALQALSHQEVTLIFLDIRMPDISGMDFIKAAQKKAHYILCTAHRDHALESYEYGVVDYLLKPIEYPRFLLAVHKAIERMNVSLEQQAAEKATILIKTDNGLEKIDCDSIVYIEVVKNYTAVYCLKSKYIIRSSLSAFEEQLPKGLFLRVHNSYIVNKRFVAGVKGSELRLKDFPQTITIGITYKQSVNDFFKLEGHK